MTQITATLETIEFLKNQPRFSTLFSDRMNDEREVFATLEEATKHYETIHVMEVARESDSYWRNNKEGYKAELTELLELPISLIKELNECESEEEMMEEYMADDVHHTYANRIETKFSYLSDEWNNELGKDGEFVIKEKKVAGITYETHFGEIEMIKLSDIL